MSATRTTHLPPTPTAEQREQARAARAEADQVRQTWSTALSHGAATVGDVFDEIDTRPRGALSRMRVQRLLTSVPSIGSVTADRIMDECGVPANRRLQGLGTRQRTALLQRTT